MSEDKVLVLRTCDAEMRSSHGGFVWPESGPVSAPDWDPTPKCGRGLHGLLRGEGDGTLLAWEDSAKWLVVEVLACEIVLLDDGEKVKFPRGVVVYAGHRCTATAMIAERYPAAAAVGAIRSAGYRGTATAGYRGTATAGYGGTAIAGDYGTAAAGDGGTLAIWYSDADCRRRLAVAYVGEGGILPNVAYRLDPQTQKFVEARG